MREQFDRINNPRSPSYTVSTKINLPPAYLLIHRTWLGGIGLLSQLEAEAPFRAILEEYAAGLRRRAGTGRERSAADPEPAAAEPVAVVPVPVPGPREPR